MTEDERAKAREWFLAMGGDPEKVEQWLNLKGATSVVADLNEWLQVKAATNSILGIPETYLREDVLLAYRAWWKSVIAAPEAR